MVSSFNAKCRYIRFRNVMSVLGWEKITAIRVGYGTGENHSNNSCYYADTYLYLSWGHPALVVHPTYIPERVDIIQKTQIKNYIHCRNNGLRNRQQPAKGL